MKKILLMTAIILAMFLTGCKKEVLETPEGMDDTHLGGADEAAREPAEKSDVTVPSESAEPSSQPDEIEIPTDETVEESQEESTPEENVPQEPEPMIHVSQEDMSKANELLGTNDAQEASDYICGLLTDYNGAIDALNSVSVIDRWSDSAGDMVIEFQNTDTSLRHYDGDAMDVWILSNACGSDYPNVVFANGMPSDDDKSTFYEALAWELTDLPFGAKDVLLTDYTGGDMQGTNIWCGDMYYEVGVGPIEQGADAASLDESFYEQHEVSKGILQGSDVEVLNTIYKLYDAALESDYSTIYIYATSREEQDDKRLYLFDMPEYDAYDIIYVCKLDEDRWIDYYGWNEEGLYPITRTWANYNGKGYNAQ